MTPLYEKLQQPTFQLCATVEQLQQLLCNILVPTQVMLHEAVQSNNNIRNLCSNECVACTDECTQTYAPIVITHANEEAATHHAWRSDAHVVQPQSYACETANSTCNPPPNHNNHHSKLTNYLKNSNTCIVTIGYCTSPWITVCTLAATACTCDCNILYPLATSNTIMYPLETSLHCKSLHHKAVRALQTPSPKGIQSITFLWILCILVFLQQISLNHKN
jgi:hypothetical protein